MKIILALIHTVERDLTGPINLEVHVGDSSDRGFGLITSTTATSAQIRREMRHQERWRFIESNGRRQPLCLQAGLVWKQERQSFLVLFRRRGLE